MKWLTQILLIVVVSTTVFITMGILQYPLDAQDKEILKNSVREFLPDLFFDVYSRRILHYSSMYESLDGVSLQGNAPTINDTGITMATAAVLNSTSVIIKDAVAQKGLTFGKKQLFRITLEFDSITAMNAHFSVGLFGLGENYYGFEVTDGVLKGSSSNQDTLASNATKLMTLSALTTYELEARLDVASNRVVFLVDGVEKGAVQGEIPEGRNTSGQYIVLGNFLDWYIKTTDTDAKSVIIGSFEYFQERYTQS